MTNTNYQVHDELYQQARKKGWEGWGGNKRLSEAALVKRFLALNNRPASGALLEIGCGEGHHCRSFEKLGFDVTGIDISSTAIEWAKEKSAEEGLVGNYFSADITLDDFAFPKKYNVIIDGNCLHCIIGADRTKLLKRVFENLENNGTFFVSSLCTKGEQSYETYRNGYAYRYVASPKCLLSELKSAGFTIYEHTIYERDQVNHITVHAKRGYD